MENHDLSGVSDHQFTLDSFTTETDHHVGKFDANGTASLIGNVSVSVSEPVIDTAGLVSSFSSAPPSITESPITTASASGSMGHVTLSDISSNLPRLSSGPGGLLTGTVISPESLRAVTSIFQSMPDSLSQPRTFTSSSVSSAITDSLAGEGHQEGSSHNIAVGLNIVAGSLGALSEKEVGRSGALSEQSALGMGIYQTGDNPLSAITSSCNVVFTTNTNTTSLISTAALTQGDGESIDIGASLQAEGPAGDAPSSLTEMMVAGVEDEESSEARQLPVTCRLTSQELARLVQTVEQVSSDVGDIGGGAIADQAVSLVHVGGVPSVELSSTGQLVIRQGSVVYTQDNENLVAMTTQDDEGNLSAVQNEGSIMVNIAPTQTAERDISKKVTVPTTEKKKAKGGWPKGRKRKKDVIKMANAPKPPSTAYAMFLAEQRSKVLASHPELSGSRVPAFLGKMWSGLPPEEKRKYVEMERRERERYLKEIKEYQETSSCQALLNKQTKEGMPSLAGTDEDIEEHISKINKTDMLGCNHLHCRVCNMYFTNNHNMQQHVLGKQHMTALAAKIYEMDQETLGLSNLENQTQDASTSTECRSCKCFKEGMPDTEGFCSTFLDLHCDRELELRELRRQHAISIHEQLSLRKKFKELQDTLHKMESDHRNLKLIGSNLQSQLDGVYRMILFLT
ncbi:uncharacterized protein [Diadema antillarum]|uniref:uncharacterized protein n=1 Tax=Diadema antillarum TaxID=105358 RepID=UPI003A8833A5